MAPLLKLIHIVGLVLWLGPSLGGFLFLLEARRTADARLQIWLQRGFVRLVDIEHLGLALLLSSGIAMVRAYDIGVFDLGWLKWKLAVIGLLVVPLEICDIYVNNFLLAPALRRAGVEITPELERAIRAQDLLIRASIPLLAIALPLIFYLAIFKP